MIKFRFSIFLYVFFISIFQFALADSQYAHNVLPSDSPPGNIALDNTPLFIAFSVNDNFTVDNGSDLSSLGGLEWIIDVFGNVKNPQGSGAAKTFDDQHPHVTFFNVGSFLSREYGHNVVKLKANLHSARLAGHEMANKTMTHRYSDRYGYYEWSEEIQACAEQMRLPFNPNEVPYVQTAHSGIGAEEIVGFRAPYFEYNNPMYTVLQNRFYRYDSSVVEGYEYSQNGTNFYWPYTLDNGSPGADIWAYWHGKDRIGYYPGLWEIPNYVLMAQPALISKMSAAMPWWQEDEGKVEATDYTLYSQFKLNADDFYEMLKYNLHLRLQGNRAPLTFAIDTRFYSDEHYSYLSHSTASERREALKAFVDYALTIPEVRLVSHIELVDWLEEPVPLMPLN